MTSDVRTAVRRNSWINIRCGVTAVVVGAFSMGNASIAQAVDFRAEYSGAVSTTAIDLNVDEEETARDTTGVGRGTVIGPFVFHEIRESDLLEPGHVDNRCDEDEIELIDIHWTMVMTDHNGQSQLYFRLAEDQPSMICIDPDSAPTGGGARTHDFDIIGGTERFAAATGRVTVECNGRALAAGIPAGGPAHGAVSCKMYGYLYY